MFLNSATMDIMDFVPTIGLEVHVELKTRTKMFCDSLNDPDGKHPNTNVCPVCLGHPGTLPTINKKAVESVLKVGLALGSEIARAAKFDRKNYFYPDLPKGYQISQYDMPLVTGGEMKLKSGNIIKIRRIHLEEDAGRLVHDSSPSTGPSTPSSGPRGSGRPASLVDFNRAGVPLMELVTEPDFKSAEETVEFAKNLQLLLRYLGVSDADMEKGQLRVEANISLGQWVRGKWKMGTKVEIKNLNSFKAVHDAIAYEIARQAEIIKRGAKVVQETRGWNDVGRVTVGQRGKEEAHDYRYFPEPDLPPLETRILDLEKLKHDLPELPNEKRERFMKEYSLGEAQATLLVDDPALANFYEAAASELAQREKEEQEGRTGIRKAQQLLFNYLTSDLRGFMNEAGVSFEELKISPEHLAHVVDLIADGKIMSRQAKDILAKMLKTGADPEDILEADGLHTISDEVGLMRIVEEVIKENPHAVEHYKKGKTVSMQFLIGKAMGKLKGRGNPEKLKEIFMKHLG